MTNDEMFGTQENARTHIQDMSNSARQLSPLRGEQGKLDQLPATEGSPSTPADLGITLAELKDLLESLHERTSDRKMVHEAEAMRTVLKLWNAAAAWYKHAALSLERDNEHEQRYELRGCHHTAFLNSSLVSFPNSGLAVAGRVIHVLWRWCPCGIFTAATSSFG